MSARVGDGEKIAIGRVGIGGNVQKRIDCAQQIAGAAGGRWARWRWIGSRAIDNEIGGIPFGVGLAGHLAEDRVVGVMDGDRGDGVAIFVGGRSNVDRKSVV